MDYCMTFSLCRTGLASRMPASFPVFLMLEKDRDASVERLGSSVISRLRPLVFTHCFNLDEIRINA